MIYLHCHVQSCYVSETAVLHVWQDLVVGKSGPPLFLEKKNPLQKIPCQKDSTSTFKNRKKKKKNTIPPLSPPKKYHGCHGAHQSLINSKQKSQPKTNQPNPTWDQITDPPWLHRIKPLDAISPGNFHVSALLRLRLRAPARSNRAVSSCRNDSQVKVMKVSTVFFP